MRNSIALDAASLLTASLSVVDNFAINRLKWPWASLCDKLVHPLQKQDWVRNGTHSPISGRSGFSPQLKHSKPLVRASNFRNDWSTISQFHHSINDKIGKRNSTHSKIYCHRRLSPRLKHDKPIHNGFHSFNNGACHPWTKWRHSGLQKTSMKNSKHLWPQKLFAPTEAW